jgi:NhaP-type Na+/H+ or K+/H+ antiporter
MFYDFYLVKNHKITNNLTIQAREKISTVWGSLEFLKNLSVFLLNLKTDI